MFLFAVPSDPAGILFSAVTAGIPFPAGPGPVDPVWTLSLSDQAGVLSPAIPAGMLFPVGPDQDGTLSPTDPAGILFPTDSAGMLFPAIPAGMSFPVDPDIDGTLSPTDPAGVLFPAVLMEFPVLKDPVVAQLPAYITVFDTGSVVDVAIMEEMRPAVPDVGDSRAVVAMVGVDAVQIGEEIPVDCDDYCDMRDPRNDFEMVDGMPVYYGGDFDDLDCDDPLDLAYEDWVDWDNLNALEGCSVDLPDKEEVRLPNAMGAMVMMVGEVAQPAHVQQDLLETSLPVMDIAITVPVRDIPMAGRGPLSRLSLGIPGMILKLYMGCPSTMEGILMIRTMKLPGIMIMTPGRTGVILTFGIGIVGFPRTTRKPSCL